MRARKRFRSFRKSRAAHARGVLRRLRGRFLTGIVWGKTQLTRSRITRGAVCTAAAAAAVIRARYVHWYSGRPGQKANIRRAAGSVLYAVCARPRIVRAYGDFRFSDRKTIAIVGRSTVGGRRTIVQ